MFSQGNSHFTCAVKVNTGGINNEDVKKCTLLTTHGQLVKRDEAILDGMSDLFQFSFMPQCICYAVASKTL